MSRNQKETPPFANREDRGIGLICAAVVNGLIIPPGTLRAHGPSPRGTHELPPTYTGTSIHGMFPLRPVDAPAP
ncbi:hypothetical protein GCM10009551_057070 [Nocardiopsis tropica]